MKNLLLLVFILTSFSIYGQKNEFIFSDQVFNDDTFKGNIYSYYRNVSTNHAIGLKTTFNWDIDIEATSYDFDIATTRRQGDFAVAQAQGVVAEDLFAPAAQGGHITDTSGNRVQLVSRGDQLLRHVGLSSLGLEQHTQEIGKRRINLELVVAVRDLGHVLGRAIQASFDGG